MSLTSSSRTLRLPAEWRFCSDNHFWARGSFQSQEMFRCIRPKRLQTGSALWSTGPPKLAPAARPMSYAPSGSDVSLIRSEFSTAFSSSRAASCPTSLVACAETPTGFAMEVFVEQYQITPVGVATVFCHISMTRPPAMFIGQKDI